MKTKFFKLSVYTICMMLAICTLAGCNGLLMGTAGVYSYFEEDAFEKTGYASDISIDALPDAYSDAIVKIEGCLMHTAKLTLLGEATGHVHVYNLNDEKEVFFSETAKDLLIFDGGFAVDNGETTTLYNNSGISIATTDHINLNNCGVTTSTSGDFVEFDNRYYRVADGEMMLLDELLPSSLMKAVNYKNNYYYITDKEVIVYGSDRKILAAKKITSFGETPNTAILSNGNVMIQTYREAADGDEYHIVSSTGKKYVLVTQLLELYANILRNVECNYIIRSVSALDNYNNEDIGIILPNNDHTILYKIENKRIDSSPTECIISPADLSIEYEATDFYPYAESIEIISRDVFAVRVIGGNDYHILASTGDLVAQLPELLHTTKFIVSEGRIFDIHMNEIYDFYHNGYDVVRTVGDSVVLEKNEDYYIFSNDTPEYIGKIADISFEFGNIYVKTVLDGESTIYIYYDDNGEKLFSTNGETSKIVWREKYIKRDESQGYYVGYTVNNKTGKSAYYKLSITYSNQAPEPGARLLPAAETN